VYIQSSAHHDKGHGNLVLNPQPHRPDQPDGKKQYKDIRYNIEYGRGEKDLCCSLTGRTTGDLAAVEEREACRDAVACDDEDDDIDYPAKALLDGKAQVEEQDRDFDEECGEVVGDDAAVCADLSRSA
jgi:hypothetical protein